MRSLGNFWKPEAWPITSWQYVESGGQLEDVCCILCDGQARCSDEPLSISVLFLAYPRQVKEAASHASFFACCTVRYS